MKQMKFDHFYYCAGQRYNEVVLKMKKTNLFSRVHCLISALSYASNNNTAKVPCVISEGNFKMLHKVCYNHSQRN